MDGGLAQREAADERHRRLRVDRVRFRIGARARPVGAAARVADVDRAAQAAGRLAEQRRVEHPGDAVVLEVLERLRAHRRREVDQIVGHLQQRASVGRRLGRERLRRRRLLPRHVGLLHRPLFDRPDRLAGDAIEHVEKRLLARHRDRLDQLAVHVGVEQDRRRRHVVVPDRVMHDLEVPLALAGLQIDADDAVAEQVVAGTMAAVVVRRRILDRQIDQAGFLVDRDLRPDAGVAVDRPRLVLPACRCRTRRAAESC